MSALGAVSCVSAAHAQFAVYGTVVGERVRGFTCATICASTDGSERPYGGSFGAFYNFRTYGPMRLGVETS